MTDTAVPSEGGDITSHVGARIRQLRRARGLTQEELARPGVSASYLSLIEAGRRPVTTKVLATIADALGCSVEQLASIGTDEMRERQLELRYAELALESGEAAEAERRFRALLDVPDESIVAGATWGLARALEALGELEEAVHAYEQFRERAVANPADESWLRAVVALSRCYRETGDLGRAIDVGEAALDHVIQRGLSGSDAQVEVVSTLAAAYYERGDLARATYLVQRAIGQAERAGSRRARGAAYWNASLIAHEAGRSAEAIDHAERALALFAEGDDRRSVSRLRNAHAAYLLRATPPEPERALELLRRCVEELAEYGTEVDLAYCWTEIGLAHYLRGDPAEALTAAETALVHLGEEPRLERARALTVVALAQAAAGDTRQADAARATASALLQQSGASRQAARSWRELAEGHEVAGDPFAAAAAYRAALDSTGIRATVLKAPEIATASASEGLPLSS